MRKVGILSLLITLAWPLWEGRVQLRPQPASLQAAVKKQVGLLKPDFQAFLNDYEAELLQRFRQEGVPGGAFAIVKNGAIASIRTFGYRTEQELLPVDEHTVFRIASLSKGMTGLLAASMVKDSFLNWEAPLSSFCSDSLRFYDDDYAEQLQLQHLLSHTTGLPRHTYSHLLNVGWPYEQILNMLPNVAPSHQVGVYHNYQNVAFNLAGDMLQMAGGKSLEALMRERFFQPLGMLNASASYSGMIESENRAMPMRRARGGYQPAILEPDYYEVPAAAGVNASIRDMANYLKMAMGARPEVLDSSAMQQAFAPFVEIPAGDASLRNWYGYGLKDAHYGMGWRIMQTEDYKIIGHSGYVNYYRAEIAFNPAEDIGIVLLTNAPNYTVGSSIPDFFQRYHERFRLPKTQPCS